MINFKPHCKDDILFRVKWLNNKKATAFAIDNPDKLTTLSDQEEWFKRYEKDSDKKFFTIFDEDIPIGFMGLSKIDRINKTANVFILIGEDDYRGKGIGTIAMNFLIERAIVDIGLKELTLEVNKFNIDAIKLYKKLGFEVVGGKEGEIFMIMKTAKL